MAIRKAIKELVADRAGHRCEYCLASEELSFLSFHIDHIVARKHGGSHEPDNLALACPHCNISKGSDLSTLLEGVGVQELYHPRLDSWEEHFRIDDGMIEGITNKGKATVRLLKMNDLDRVLIRKVLIEAGSFP